MNRTVFEMLKVAHLPGDILDPLEHLAVSLDAVVAGRFSRVVHDVKDDEVLLEPRGQLGCAGDDVIGDGGEVHRDENGSALGLLRHETHPIGNCGVGHGASAQAPWIGTTAPGRCPPAPHHVTVFL